MNVLALDARLWKDAKKHDVLREDLLDVVQTAAIDAEKQLKIPLPYLNIIFSPTRPEWVIPETGVMGTTYSDEYISMTFDPAVPFGKDILVQCLRSQVFHEMTHAAYFAHDEWRPGVLFGAVTEGLATVFERDYGGNGEPLWAKYEDDATMRSWYEELKNLSEGNEKNMDYFVHHPDGRKWIVYKTGVWMVDKLVKDGATFDELMAQPYGEILTQFDELLAS